MLKIHSNTKITREYPNRANIYDNCMYRCNFFTHIVFIHFISGLSLVITPVLAGLLETDFMKMMNFKDFFEEVERIAKLKVCCHGNIVC